MPFHKNLYEQIQYETAHGVAVADPPEDRPLLPLILWCALPGAALLLFAALRSNQAVMDAVVFGFTTPLKHVLARFNDHFPYAVGELIWTLALLAALIFLLRSIWLFIRGPERLRILLRRMLALTGALLLIACSYTLMWGCNYYATSFAQRSGLSQRGLTTQELTRLTAAFARQCTELAPQQERDAQGVVRFQLESLFDNSAQLYAGIEQEFPALQVERHDPKPMLSSKALSLTGFSGFYFPMTAESIVNIDQTSVMIPSTILHELAHQCNVAEEDAANFVAILAGLRCDDVRFQYSSSLLGYIHLSNALYDASPAHYQAVTSLLSEDVRRDLLLNDQYWHHYDTPVSQVSEQVYTGFLDSYGQSDGMKSYGLCINLLSSYYYGENGRWAQERSEEPAPAQESAPQVGDSSAPAQESAPQEGDSSAPAQSGDVQTASAADSSAPESSAPAADSGSEPEDTSHQESDSDKKGKSKAESKSDKNGKSKTESKSDKKNKSKADSKSDKESKSKTESKSSSKGQNASQSDKKASSGGKSTAKDAKTAKKQ